MSRPRNIRVLKGTYPREAAPMRMNDVPTRAENARNTKKAARFGASAVPRLNAKNQTALVRAIFQPCQILTFRGPSVATPAITGKRVQARILGNTHRPSPEYLAHRPPDYRRHAHERHVSGVAGVDDRASRVVLGSHLRGC